MTTKRKPDLPRTADAPRTEPTSEAEAASGFPSASTSDEDGAVVEGDGGPALARLQNENAELKDRLLRALAEVENVRRRAERDVNDARQYAVAKFAGDILGVADNLERALASVPGKLRQRDPAIRTLVEGVALTENELLGTLEKHGVRKLNPVGERFDPNFHEALFEVPDATMPRGTVAQVVEPGYSIGSRPLRPAKVGVATGGRN